MPKKRKDETAAPEVSTLGTPQEAAQEAEPMVKGHLDREQLSGMETAALLKLAQEMGLTVPGPEDRDAILDAITAEEVSAPATEEPEPQKPEPKPQPPGREESPEGHPIPYKATVSTAALVFRYKPDGVPVGTIARGEEVTVTARTGEYAQLDNGIFVKEAFLTPR